MMKRAICRMILTFIGLVALWTGLEYIYSQTIGGDFMQNITNPIHLIPCIVAAVLAAACGFLLEEGKTRCRNGKIA